MARAYIPTARLSAFHAWLKKQDLESLLEVWVFCKTKGDKALLTGWTLKVVPHGLCVMYLNNPEKFGPRSKPPFSRLDLFTVISKHEEACREAAKPTKKVDDEEDGKKTTTLVTQKKPDKPVDQRILAPEAQEHLMKKLDPEMARLYAEWRKEEMSGDDDEREFVGEDKDAMARRQKRIRRIPELRRETIAQVLQRSQSGRFCHIPEAADGLPYTVLTGSLTLHPSPDVVAAVVDEDTAGKMTIGRWLRQDEQLYFIVEKNPADVARDIATSLSLRRPVKMGNPPPPGKDADLDIHEALEEEARATGARASLSQGVFWFGRPEIRPLFTFLLDNQPDATVDRLFGKAPFLTGTFEKKRDPASVVFSLAGSSAGNRDLATKLVADLKRRNLYGTAAVVVKGRGFQIPDEKDSGSKGPDPELLKKYAEFQRTATAGNRTRGPHEAGGKFWFAAKGLDQKPILMLYGTVLPPSVKDMAASEPCIGTWKRDDAKKLISIKVDGGPGPAKGPLEAFVKSGVFPPGYRAEIR